MEASYQRHAPDALPPRKTQGAGGWVGRPGWAPKISHPAPNKDSIPEPSRPYQVTTPTELSRPTLPEDSKTNVEQPHKVRIW